MAGIHFVSCMENGKTGWYTMVKRMISNNGMSTTPFEKKGCNCFVKSTIWQVPQGEGRDTNPSKGGGSMG